MSHSIAYSKHTSIGDYASVKSVLGHVLKFVDEPRNDATRATFLTSLHNGLKRSKATPTFTAASLSVWTAVLEALEDGDPPLDIPLSLPGIHPVIVACLNDQTLDPLDANMDVFWGAAPKRLYRAKRANSVGSRGGTAEPEGGRAGGEEEEESAEAQSGFDLPDAPAGGNSEDERDWEDIHHSEKEAAALNGERPRAKRPVASDFNDTRRAARVEVPIFDDPTPRESTAAARRKAFFSSIEVALDTGTEDDDDDLIGRPPHVLICRLRQRDFKQYAVKAKGEESLAFIAAQVQVEIDPKDKGRLLCGEFVPLADICGYSPESTLDLPEGFDALNDAKIEAVRASRRSIFYGPMALLDAWEQVSKLDGRFFPERKAERKIFGIILKAALKNVDDATCRRVLRWVDANAKHIATVGGRVRDWGQVTGNDALYHEIVVAPAAALAALGADPSGKRRKVTNSDEICKNANAEVPIPPPTARKTGAMGAAAFATLPLALLEEEEEFGAEATDPSNWPWLQLDDDEELPEINAPRPPAHHLAGVGVAPRLRRLWHWPEPHLDPPRNPLLSSTYTAKPLPRPPQHVLEDPGYLAALKSHPELFSVGTCPLNVEAFRKSLETHPNRPWVESLLWSMEHGMWPCHSGEAPAPPPARLVSRYIPSTEEDLDLVQAKVEKDVAKGLTSEAVDEPPEGCVISPLFAVHREGHSPRVVNDQTASGLNEGTLRKDCPAIFDSVVDLIRIMRHKGLESVPPLAVLWKTDVSSAFKTMLMHTAWQYRQAIAVSYKQPDGSRKIRYHIEWRGAFGSRGTPYLWTSIMAALLWIVQQRGDVENPVAYMDDALGYDTSGILVERTYNGVTKAIPLEMAATLDVWKEHDVPFNGFEKAEFGRSLTTLGIQLDLDALTASLPAASIDKFAVEVADFLATENRAPALKRWRSITGYGSHVCTVVPHARLWLTPLYEKLSFPNGTPKSRALAGVFINQPCRESLEKIVQELQRGEPLSLLDPGLTEWKEEDADLVIYTDACLETVEGKSGLGFWFVHNGVKQHFYCRPDKRYRKIQLAETLCVAAAIKAVAGFGIRRLLIRTDSSAAVFAYDSGSAHDTEFLPLRSITLASYELLRARKIDVRVLHVRGKDNDLADRLSRAPIRALLRDYLNIHAFNEPTEAGFGKRIIAPSKKRFAPIPNRAALEAERDVLWSEALAPRTFKQYRGHLKMWKVFSLSLPCDPIPTADTLSLFVTWRQQRVVNVYPTLSGLAYMLGPQMGAKKWTAARFSPEVLRALRGSAKIKAHRRNRAPPLPHSKYVEALRIGLDPKATYDTVMWAANVATLFLCCGRAGETTDADSPEFRNDKQRMRRETTFVTMKGFRSYLPYQKASPLYAGSHYYWVTADAGLDAVRLISRYMRARDALFGPTGPLWMRRNGTVPVRRWLVEKLKQRWGRQFTGHSMRPGGASWYVLKGANDRTVQRQGRWSSKAWEDYIRIEPEVAMAARIRDAVARDPSIRALETRTQIEAALAALL
ncbi:hypothetical protein P7C70_g2031, partial [Phenoliferia sp. Uapishka_3]